MDLIGMQIADNRRTVKMTLLHRKDGKWLNSEIADLTNNLRTEVSGHPQHPEYLILWGHHSKEKTLEAIGGGLAYTATQIEGIEDKGLPWIPSFV